MFRNPSHWMPGGPQEFAWAWAYGVGHYWAYGVTHYAVSQDVPYQGASVQPVLVRGRILGVG